MKKLKSVYLNKDVIEVIFNMSHSNNKTIVDQDVYLKKENGFWTASISFEKFPECDNPTKAAHKLAEWMERLSGSILNEDYDSIDLNNI